MSIFADSTAALGQVFADAAGETVTYRRDAISAEITAWRSPEPALFAVDAGGGVVETYESWEWHCQASALGALGTPVAGDRIVAADGRTYEVLALPGQQAFIGDALLRIHTKRVAAG